MKLLERITSDPRVMTGQPCIRGQRITVANILRLLAAGHTHERILIAYPEVDIEDIEACLAFAAWQATYQDFELPLAS
jgi:uncharacterized protein (DUF433 family)